MWETPEAGMFVNTQGETAPSAETTRARPMFSVQVRFFFPGSARR